MINKIKIILPIICFFTFSNVKAQIDVSSQLNTIPSNIGNYIDGYLHDLSTLQGVTYLNSVHTTGKVLGKWELNLSVNTGAAVKAPYYIDNNFGENFELRGEVPSLFGNGNEGELFFHIIDDATGAGIVDPFTGEDIGFSIPLLPGSDLGVGLSPAVMPVVTLGVGFDTEISVSVLPGAIKAASKSFTGDFEIDKDMMYSIGVRHDLFHWIPKLAKHNLRLTVGATYNRMTVGATAGKGLFDDFTNMDSDLLSATNNLTGIEYGFNSLGFEAMLSKKLAFIDLSLYASSNQSKYYIQSEGNIVVRTASNFYGDNTTYNTTTLENLVDIEGTTKRFVYGAAIQFNLGRFNLGVKYGVADEEYLAASIGFKILKNK